MIGAGFRFLATNYLLSSAKAHQGETISFSKEPSDLDDRPTISNPISAPFSEL